MGGPAQDIEAAGCEGDVADRLRVPVVLPGFGARHECLHPGRTVDMDVEIGCRSRRALGEDPGRRVRDPTAPWIPREDGKERSQPDAACVA
jgi:hypothetical protein